MSKVKDGNYIVIQSFMVNDLQLKGTELLIYAIIYGFSQDEEQKFTGSLQYLADWTNSTKQSVINNLKSLVDKDLIGKKENIINGVKFIEYYSKNFNGGIKKILMGGIKKSLINNIDNNNINNKYIYMGVYKRIKLTQEQYDKLIVEFGKEYINQIIEKLDEYVESNNNKNKYTNYNLVIRKAIREKWFNIKKAPSWLNEEIKDEGVKLTDDEIKWLKSIE